MFKHSIMAHVWEIYALEDVVFYIVLCAIIQPIIYTWNVRLHSSQSWLLGVGPILAITSPKTGSLANLLRPTASLRVLEHPELHS